MRSPRFERQPSCLIRFLGVLVASLIPAEHAVAASEIPVDQLADLSIEQLLNSPVTVSSVARRPGSVQRSPAAVTIVSQEDIRRSGATSIAEALRDVPGLDVARVDAHAWAISSRGFNDLFANKLLVMMDGRSVYTSVFSGTFWDVQDTMLEDVARIEVVRGPGASLWGANAVNGVINVVSKNTANTQGLLLSSGVGSEERGFGGIRYGGKITQRLHYRVYGKYSKRDNSAVQGTGFPKTLIQIEIPGGGGGGGVGSAASPPAATHDAWEMTRAGFRFDLSSPQKDLFTLQGDIYSTDEDQLYQRVTPLTFGTFYEPVTDTASGGNIVARWTRTLSNDSEFIFQTYFDRSDRELAVLGGRHDAFDVDFQHQLGLGERQTMVWGAGFRRLSDQFRNSIEVALDPAERTTELFGAFVQDEIALVEQKVGLTLGARLERNEFTGFEFQPNARLLWSVDQRTTLWTSVSRAVRTPSRAENDFRVNFPGVAKDVIAPGFPAITIGILGNRDLEPETLTAYEVGYRAQLHDRVSAECSVFFNKYDELRSFRAVNPALDFSQSPVEINATLENKATGETVGGEISTHVQISERWRLRADYAHLRTSIYSTSNVNLGSFGSESAEGANPRHRAGFRSWVDLGRGFEFDSALHYVAARTSLEIPAYLELDLRVGWRMSDNAEFSLVGQNLLDRAHPEFKPSFFGTQATEVQRSIHGKITLRF
jgi:iron complex outermembrane receptor protein